MKIELKPKEETLKMIFSQIRCKTPREKYHKNLEGLHSNSYVSLWLFANT